jgi:SAM-dependent methyltransferase
MIRSFLPYSIFKVLFGDRKTFGLKVWEKDSCWEAYQKIIFTFYVETQKNSIGSFVNNSGYKILKDVNLEGKKVLEIGPGDIAYLKYIKYSKYSHFDLVDVNTEMLDKSSEKLLKLGISSSSIVIDKNTSKLPLKSEDYDVIMSFYALEHIYPLEPYILELKRLLKPGGIIIGAIPCEGGLAWGLGRFLTTRRWFKKNTKINPDKIICWEHPNFADEINHILEYHFKKQKLKFWPFPFLKINDFNLVEKFIYIKN